MAEISARDLRRLQGLESKLEKTTTERKELAAERRELRSAVNENARLAKANEKDAREASSKLDAVVAENEKLATTLDEVTGDLEQLKGSAEKLRAALDAARAEVKKAKAAQKQLSAAVTDRDRIDKTLAIANKQLAGQKIDPVLPADQVAQMLNDLVVGLSTKLPGLAIRDGQMRLNVAFGNLGKDAGFVIPSADSPPELRENLHEVAFRFDTAADRPKAKED
jgi:chromosome segregation ATPase